jgi:hypothetical protein
VPVSGGLLGLLDLPRLLLLLELLLLNLLSSRRLVAGWMIYLGERGAEESDIDSHKDVRIVMWYNEDWIISPLLFQSKVLAGDWYFHVGVFLSLKRSSGLPRRDWRKGVVMSYMLHRVGRQRVGINGMKTTSLFSLLFIFFASHPHVSVEGTKSVHVILKVERVMTKPGNKKKVYKPTKQTNNQSVRRELQMKTFLFI